MGALTDQAAIVYRDFEIEGDAGSGAHKPIKDEIRALFEQTETAIAGGGGGTVMGPASAVASNIAIFSGTSGNVIQDGGKKISDLATAAALVAGLAGKANVDHTHDQDDITDLVSDLAAKATLASPHFTGIPTAPTAGVSDNSTQLATTGFVKAALAATVVFPSLTVNAGAILIDRTGDAASANFRIAGDAGQQRDISFRTGTIDRWTFRAGMGAESGANAGSDLSLIAYDDAGASLGSVWQIVRASRVFNFTNSPTAPTPAAGDSSSKIATTAYVDTRPGKYQAIPNKTGSSVSITVADYGSLVRLDRATAQAVTLPNDTTLAVPVNTWIDFMQVNAGQSTFAPEAGATMTSRGGLTKTLQWGIVRAIKQAASTWSLSGDGLSA